MEKKQPESSLKPFNELSVGRYLGGLINIQSLYFMIPVTFLKISILIAYSDKSSDDWWQDLINGNPEYMQLGMKRFKIYGVTFPFEYPFRLARRTLSSALTPWICFAIHQVGAWYIIYAAKEAKKRGEITWTDSSKWNPYAWSMLKLNVFMVALHYLQSNMFYDGLAATFPEISTLFAGVSSILVVYAFELKRRGFIFGYTPVSFESALGEFTKLLREYHGYLASFGIILTFWYHTMESTFAHLTGFIHIFLLLWQSSLIYQQAHKNLWWRLLLEMWILVHGSVVAYYQGILGGGLYCMFLTSFTLLFLMGPLWGVPVVKDYIEKSKEGRTKRILTVILPLGVLFGLWAFRMFASVGKPQLFGMIFALPGLYYTFIGWYYGFFYYGKLLDNFISGKTTRKGKLWWAVMNLWGALSLGSIMFLAEFVYRLFVPYSPDPRP